MHLTQLTPQRSVNENQKKCYIMYYNWEFIMCDDQVIEVKLVSMGLQGQHKIRVFLLAFLIPYFSKIWPGR